MEFKLRLGEVLNLNYTLKENMCYLISWNPIKNHLSHLDRWRIYSMIQSDDGV